MAELEPVARRTIGARTEQDPLKELDNADGTEDPDADFDEVELEEEVAEDDLEV